LIAGYTVVRTSFRTAMRPCLSGRVEHSSACASLLHTVRVTTVQRNVARTRSCLLLSNPRLHFQTPRGFHEQCFTLFLLSPTCTGSQTLSRASSPTCTGSQTLSRASSPTCTGSQTLSRASIRRTDQLTRPTGHSGMWMRLHTRCTSTCTTWAT
jgi:hypothetical protein